MEHHIFVYILIASLVSFLIRVLPLTIIRKPIRNQFLRSFLYYVPYVTLAVMTFPSIMDVTHFPWVGLIAMLTSIVVAMLGAGLFPVACVSCITVLLLECVM